MAKQEQTAYAKETFSGFTQPAVISLKDISGATDKPTPP